MGDAQRDIDTALKLTPADKEVLYKKALIQVAGALQALAEALSYVSLDRRQNAEVPENLFHVH